MSSQLAAALIAHKLPLLATYGQTETCGYVLGGRIAQQCMHAAMLPISPSVGFQLASDGAHPHSLGEREEGAELLLFGCASARSAQARDGVVAPTSRDSASELYSKAAPHPTGDLFRLVDVGGVTMLEFVCRSDDVLLLTSGEMSNPLLIELTLFECCSDDFSAFCVLGNGLPRPVLVAELRDAAAPSPTVVESLAAAIAHVNRIVPSYSTLRAEHVIVVSPLLHQPLPRSVKGQVRRAELHHRFARQLQLWFGDAGVELSSDEAAEAGCLLGCLRGSADVRTAAGSSSPTAEGAVVGVSVDSLQLTSSSHQPVAAGGEVVAHIYMIAMSLVLLHHMTKLKEGCAQCGRGLLALEALGEAVAMPTFCVLAGISDQRQPTASAMRKLAVKTTVLFGISLYITYFSSLPDNVHWFYRYMIFGINKGMQKAPYREYFVMHTWFLIALPAWRLLHAALRSFGWERALPALGVLIHFGCWGNNCRWPFLRHPHDLEDSVVAYGYFSGSRFLKSIATSLPQNDLSVIAPFTLFYATLPSLMPRDFPTRIPNPFKHVRQPLQTPFNNVRVQAFARGFWAVGLLAMLAVFSDPALRHMTDLAFWHSKRAYGCEKSVFPPRLLVVRTDALTPCGQNGVGAWSFSGFALDAVGVALSTLGIVGLAAVVPRFRTAWTEAGERTFAVYILHLYVLPAVEVPFTAFAQVIAHAIHPEAVAPVALIGAVVLCRALALPLLELHYFAPFFEFVSKLCDRCITYVRLSWAPRKVLPAEHEPLIG